MKVIYRGNKKKWYGEFTKENYQKGYGWFQWGASPELLCKTTDKTEELTQEWIERYSNLI